jgi:hypothetical protein
MDPAVSAIFRIYDITSYYVIVFVYYFSEDGRKWFKHVAGLYIFVYIFLYSYILAGAGIYAHCDELSRVYDVKGLRALVARYSHVHLVARYAHVQHLVARYSHVQHLVARYSHVQHLVARYSHVQHFGGRKAGQNPIGLCFNFNTASFVLHFITRQAPNFHTHV